MYKLILATIPWLVTLCVTAQTKDQVTMGSMPPVVVETFPKAGAMAVDPSIKEIRVTFSKEMLTKQQWSWVMVSQASFPPVDTEKIHFLGNKRTCVAPLGKRLEPGKTYAIWLNKGRWNYFKDKRGQSSVPYLLVFQTRR